MRVLVLGSEGLIGSALAANLQVHGHHVWELDLALGEDLRQPSVRIERLIGNADYVHFQAFDVGGSQYLGAKQHSYEYLDNNVRLMHNTFDMLKRSGTPFLFASSQMSNMIDSPYGMLKRIGEFYTRSLGGKIVRFWNVYGRENDPEKFHVITDFVRAARDGTIRMRTDGTERRQFLHVVDAISALMAIQDGHLPNLDHYDITSFEWTSIYDIAALISDLTPGDVDIIRGTIKDTTQTIENEPDNTILNHWTPSVPLDSGILSLMN